MEQLSCANPGCRGEPKTIYQGYLLCGPCLESAYEIQRQLYHGEWHQDSEPLWFSKLVRVPGGVWVDDSEV